MEYTEEIDLVLKGHDGDKEEYWDHTGTYDIPQSIIERMELQLEADIFRCMNCKITLCSIIFVNGDRERKNNCICSTCAGLAYSSAKVEDIVVGTGYDSYLGMRITTNMQIKRILCLRKHQISIRAVLTLLNHRDQHRLPYDLIRTLKGYLY